MWGEHSCSPPVLKRNINKGNMNAMKKEEKKPATTARASQRRLLAQIAKIPHGKVSTYGAIARAAGIANGARQTARALHTSYGVPWHRVLGAGGAIKLTGEHAFEQRFRLQSEGVTFRGRKVDMKRHEYRFPGRSTK